MLWRTYTRSLTGRLRSTICCAVTQNPMDESILDRLQRIRAAFKVLTSVLRLKGLVYDPDAVAAAKNMAF